MSEQDLQLQITGLSETMRRHTHDDFETKKVPGVLNSVTNDTNVTGSVGSNTLTLGWTGQLSVSRGGTGQSTLTNHGVLLGNGSGAIGTTATGNSGQVLTSNGASADPTFQAPPGATTVNIGETLAIGEVIVLYKAAGSFSTDGYQMTNGRVYAVRAAATDTTYGSFAIGIMNSTGTYLGTGTCLTSGEITGLSGLTGGSKHYLQNYSGSSSTTISQATQDTAYAINTHTLSQLWIPTSSRLDTTVFATKQNGGGGGTITIALKRGNTTLSTQNINTSGDPNSLTEHTVSWGGIRVYKGELLHFDITSNDSNTSSTYIYYQSTGTPYNQVYAPDGSHTLMSIDFSTVTGASLYMKINEYTGFGTLGTSAGTRKIKMGAALSSTEFVITIQEADANL